MGSLKHLITGLTIPQEFVCLSLEDFQQLLSVFLTTLKKDFVLNVTSTHVFLGYKPLIIAIIFEKTHNEVSSEPRVCLHFCNGNFSNTKSWKGFQTDNNCQARLILKKISEKKMDDQHVIFYEGQYGEHYFLHTFHRFVNRQREKRKAKKPANVNLPGNLYDQVRIAYAIPRIIGLVTIGEGQNMNMFPTDLHGPVGKNFYASSLRHGGKANQQVEMIGKLVISFMPSSEYKQVYALGKNHMQDMRPLSDFQIFQGLSGACSHPIPAQALRYIALQRIDSFDTGIHRIHLYKKTHEEKIKDGTTLAHIHQYYAQWRADHGVETKMLLR